MKLPKLSKLFPLKTKKRLNATTVARRAAPAIDDYSDEPQTKLSSAFVVVLILHVVAVGGIYAFNSIKANRKSLEPIASVSSSAPTSAPVIQNIPVAVPKQDPVERAPIAPAAIVSPISGGRIHHVKAGETVAKITALYSVSVADLEEVNGAKNVANLHAGQVLNIPKPKPVVAAAAAKKVEEAPKVAAAGSKVAPKTYVVAKGDNPVAIARRLGVSYDELLKLNNVEDPKRLQIGQTLKVPAKKN